VVGPVARAAGLTGVIVSDEVDASTAHGIGFADIRMGRRHFDTDAAPEAAYGFLPGTRPVLSLEAEVVAVKHVPAGAGVSYGYTFRTARPTTLALIGLGYSDGVPRLASNRAQVLVNGIRRPLVGRIAMDQLVVDCGDDQPTTGDIATLFGDPDHGAPPATDWAEWTERSPLDLTAGLGVRIARRPR